MKQTIRLTEANLRNMIQEAVEDAINNGELDEGFWNQLKTGANTFMNKKGKTGSFVTNMKDKWNAAKANYQTQGELDGMNDLINKLSQFIDAGQIDPNTTIAQLVGGKYNNNKFGKMTGKMNNRKAQLRQRGFSGDFN